MAAKKRGRPPTGTQTRTASVRFYLTDEDSQWFAKFAEDLGFESHSQFWTAVAERLRSGGLAPAVWLKLGYQICGRAHQTGTSKGGGWYNPFERLEPLPVQDKPRPTPVLPDEQLTTRETKALLAEVRKELTT